MATKGTSSNKKQAGKFKHLIGPTNRAEDQKAMERLITARIGLLLRKPFYGNLATRLILVNADEWLPTIATDGRHFYYNSRFVNMLSSVKKVEFGFGHELGHCIYDHFGRKGTRDGQLWNIAGDYCINADLIDERVGERITEVDILFDPKYRGWAAEAVYDDLMQNVQKINVEQLLDRLLDDHLDGDQDGDSAGEGKDGDGKEGKRPQISAADRQKIRDEFKEAIISAAQAVGAGDLPAGVKRILQDLTNPIMNWRELIRQQIESIFRNDYSWARPSRKGWSVDAIMPGMIPGQRVEAAIAIDMSGSIGEEQARDFLTEIKGIIEQFEEYSLHVWCFDTDVYAYQQFSSDNLESIEEYQVKGGGGTDYMVNWTFMKDQNIEPKKFIMFTDMCPGGSWGDPNYCDTLFISHGGIDIEAPFGITVKYDPNV